MPIAVRFPKYGGNIIDVTDAINLILNFGPIGFCLIFAALKKAKDSVAQLVEQYTFNVWVLGSSPSRITLNIFKPVLVAGFVVLLCQNLTGGI